MRFFLVKAPPVLTLDLKLGNLCNPENPDDFLYNDLVEFIGKLEDFCYGYLKLNIYGDSFNFRYPLQQ